MLPPSISLLIRCSLAISPIAVTNPGGEVVGKYSHLAIGDTRSPLSHDYLQSVSSPLHFRILQEPNVLSLFKNSENDISSFRGFTNPFDPSIV